MAERSFKAEVEHLRLGAGGKGDAASLRAFVAACDVCIDGTTGPVLKSATPLVAAKAAGSRRKLDQSAGLERQVDQLPEPARSNGSPDREQFRRHGPDRPHVCRRTTAAL